MSEYISNEELFTKEQNQSVASYYDWYRFIISLILPFTTKKPEAHGH